MSIMQMPRQNRVQDYLEKQGLQKTFQQNEIVLVKLDVDQHEWPAKISSCFLQQKNKSSLKQSQQDDYSPSKKASKVRKPKNKRLRTYELIYKIRYFQWMEFAFVTEKQIKLYTLKMQKDLLQIQEKKLQKALKRARFEMSVQQKIRLQQQESKLLKQKEKTKLKQSKSNKKNANEQKQNNTNQREDEKQLPKDFCLTIEDQISSFTTEAQKMDKKSLKNQKIKEKKIVSIKRRPLNTETLRRDSCNQKTNRIKEGKKIDNEGDDRVDDRVDDKVGNKVDDKIGNKVDEKVDNNNVGQINQNPAVKQEYTEDPKQNNSNTHSSNSQKSDIKEEYLLDNILFKNKFQILGILSDLLEEFLCRVLWLDPKQLQKISQKEQNRINTLNKVLEAEIFKFQELSESRCIQKMLNIVKIGQLVGFPNKTYEVSLKKKLNRTYFKIMQLLRRLKFIQKQAPFIEQNNDLSLVMINTGNSKLKDDSKNSDEKERTTKGKPKQRQELKIDYKNQIKIFD